MTRDVYILLVAQFLTAFADNALLFTAIHMAQSGSNPAPWYIPALQASFLIAFVLLAPWVGPYADRRPKARVLVTGNIIKAIGAGLMLLHIEPLLSYAVVGIGAAIYGPAKYGVLPELVGPERLVTANGWIEGSTILAILLGMYFGAMIAEFSVTTALALVLALYVVSALCARLMSQHAPLPRESIPALRNFGSAMRRLLSTPRARFATLGVSMFWGVSAVLRVLLVAWIPAVLLIHESSKIAEMTMFLAVGIAIGAMLAPRFVPLAYLRRARWAAYAMGSLVLVLSAVDTVWVARVVLLCAGVAGGLLVVPINAALQEIGYHSVGAGGAVAIQHFFENVAMLVTSGLYAVAAATGAEPVPALIVLGITVVVATILLSLHLPPDTGKWQDLIPAEHANHHAK